MIKSYKYRFKTEEEFLKEFGLIWRRSVECCFSESMDYLLGNDIDEKYYNQIDYFFNKNIQRGYFDYFDYGYSCWNISIDMIKKINLIPQYNPKKFIY